MAGLVIVDYGGGNIASVMNALAREGVEAQVSSRPEVVAGADRLILPGVGAAGLALSGLRSRFLDVALREAVHDRGRPFLGICVGMQVMAARLFEYGEHEGLGWVAGNVVHLSEVAAPARIPHMGWAPVEGMPGHELPGGLRGDRQFYFCHSYALRTADTDDVAATVDAGGKIVAAVRCGTAWGVQFHPEKSHINGERMLRAFLDWSP